MHGKVWGLEHLNTIVAHCSSVYECTYLTLNIFEIKIHSKETFIVFLLCSIANALENVIAVSNAQPSSRRVPCQCWIILFTNL